METVLKSTGVEKIVDPTIDLGQLLLIDNETFDEEVGHSADELLARARNNTQLLFNSVWELEKERVEDAIVVPLPRPTYRIPREKIIPENRPPTKWEAYAKAKGIVKQKKSKKVFDETTGEWKPTFGYRRGKDDTKDWMIEIPDHQDPNADYYEQRKEAKKERIAKNETQRLKNIARQTDLSQKGKKAPLPVEKTSIGIGKDPEEKNNQELRIAADRAKAATASAGKFQDKLKLEKPNVKKGIKRKFESNIQATGTEKERYKNILERIASKQPKLQDGKLASVAGPAESERKKTNEKVRQKSQIKRQQFHQKKVKDNKKVRGNQRPEGKKPSKK